MNNFFENLNKVSKSVSLDKNRKGALRNELIRFMNSNPVKQSKVSTSGFLRVVSYFKIHRTAFIPLVACAILILGAGTSYAATGSMPGDVLYKVKVHVNEEVKAALIFNADQRADFEIDRAEARLAEADDLAVSGKLNSEIQSQVEANLNANTERVQRRIKMLEDAGETQKAADLASHFEASLNAHTNILSAIGSSKQDNEKNENNFSGFEKNVNSTATGLGKQRGDLNLKISSEKNETKVKASASGKIGAAENTIAEVKKFIELKSQNSQNFSAAKNQLKTAEELLASAKAKFEAAKYSESFELASKAQRAALSAKALVKIEHNLPERVKKELPNSIIRQERNDHSAASQPEEDRDKSNNSNRLNVPISLPKLNF